MELPRLSGIVPAAARPAPTDPSCAGVLQILGRASSINVRKVLWTCRELGLGFEHAGWGEGALSLASAEFKALNPKGLVPVLRDGSFVLSESNTICRYLANLHPHAGLLPQQAQARARVEQWMDWQATDLNRAWTYAFMALVRKSPDYADAGAVARSIEAWNRQMTILDAALAATGPYITGAQLTLADIVLGLSVHRWVSTPFDKPPLHQVERYYELLSQRPAFVEHGRNGMP